MIVVAHNIAAMNANRQLNIITNQKSKSMEKLSSGYKINRAADDAAGLAISEKLRWQSQGLTRASMNCREGIGYVQVADGALQESQRILQRLNELAVQSANGTNTTSDRAAIDLERQELVTELDKIFRDTSFNEKKIWNPDDIKLKNPPTIEYETIHNKAVDVKKTSNYSDITDENSGTVPQGRIHVNASIDEGLSFDWTGYNGYTYTTGKVDWDTIEKNGYKVKLSDLYPTGKIENNGATVSSASFYDSNGNPLIDVVYSFSRYDKATLEDVVKSLNRTNIDVNDSSPISARFEDKSGNVVGNSFTISSERLGYSSAYKSYASKQAGGPTYDQTKSVYDFDKGTDASFTPLSRDGKELNATSDDYTGTKDTFPLGNLTTSPDYDNLSVDTAKNDSTSFSFSFKLNGVGTITADLSRISYAGGNIEEPKDENVWWKWNTYKDIDGKEHKYKSSLLYSTSSADMKGLMEVLKGDGSQPGILRSSLGGKSEYGGDVYLDFVLHGSGGSSIGSFQMSTSFSKDVTEESFYNTIKSSFNENTIMDLYTSDSEEQAQNALRISPGNENYVDVPDKKISKVIWHYPLEYEADPIQLIIQDGALEGNRLDISYENMSLVTIGIAGMDMKTQESSSQAIDLIGHAIDKVSKERAVFGSYQNRLEHTIANVDTTAENTDAAESRIRDTDMSREMVYFSLQSILEQAGQSMLTQTNQINQGVLSLLQQ